MRVIKSVFSQLHRFVLWLLISAFLWGWIFLVIMDTPASKKVTVYLNTPAVLDSELAQELEKSLPQGMKTVEVHPFAYDIFANSLPSGADICIMTAAELESVKELLCPIADAGGEGCLTIEGEVYGILMYSSRTGEGHVTSFVTYAEGAAGEDYYLCFAKSSRHLGELNGSADGAARDIANALITLP